MILIIDNYDSFTYNIAQALGALGRGVKVVRNDAVSVMEAGSMSPEAIVISPGPGRPEQAGISLELVETWAGRIPILGICLGLQCIGRAFGARVEPARRPVHGKTSEVFHDGRGLFFGLRNPFVATRYHSLIVAEDGLKHPLKVSAYTVSGVVMGLRAEELAVEGVQFHPESIATLQGRLIFENFLKAYVGRPMSVEPAAA